MFLPVESTCTFVNGFPGYFVIGQVGCLEVWCCSLKGRFGDGNFYSSLGRKPWTRLKTMLSSWCNLDPKLVRRMVDHPFVFIDFSVHYHNVFEHPIFFWKFFLNMIMIIDNLPNVLEGKLFGQFCFDTSLGNSRREKAKASQEYVKRLNKVCLESSN